MPSSRSDRSTHALDALEAIEFLPPDERVFGPGDGLTFVGVDDGDWPELDDGQPGAAPRSRWAAVLAGLGVAGILAVGVVAAAPWAGDEDTAPAPPSTPATPTTASPPPNASPPPTASTLPAREASVDAAATGWVLDPLPEGFRPIQFVRTDSGDETGWGEVWAEPGASRTNGRWFSLTLLPFRELDPDGPSGFPVEVGGREGLGDVGADGVVSLAYDAGVVDAPRLITLEAFGFTVPQLVELADSIGIVDDRPQMVDDRPEFLRPELLDGLVQVAASPTTTDLTTRAVLGRGAGSIAFYGDGGPWDVTVVQEYLDDRPVEDEVLAVSLDRFVVDPSAWPAPAEFAGADLVVGARSIGSYDLTVARWHANGRTMSVLSSRGVDETLALLPSLRFADAEEWTSLEDRSAPWSPDDGRGAVGFSVVSGSLPDGRAYDVLHRAGTDELEVRVGLTSVFQPTGDAPLRVYTVDGVSFVLALTSEPAATLLVTTPNGEIGVPVTEIVRAATDGTSRTSYLGVHPMPDPADVAAFSARIVTPTGTLVASLAPWG